MSVSSPPSVSPLPLTFSFASPRFISPIGSLPDDFPPTVAELSAANKKVPNPPPPIPPTGPITNHLQYMKFVTMSDIAKYFDDALLMVEEAKRRRECVAEIVSLEEVNAKLEEEIKPLEEQKGDSGGGAQENLLYEELMNQLKDAKSKKEKQRTDAVMKRQEIDSLIQNAEDSMEEERKRLQMEIYRLRQFVQYRQLKLQNKDNEDKAEAEAEALKEAQEREELLRALEAKEGQPKQYEYEKGMKINWSAPIVEQGSPEENWGPIEEATRYSFSLSHSRTVSSTSSTIKIRMATKAFNEGGIRVVYQCQDVTDPTKPINMVAKESLEYGKFQCSLQWYKNDIRSQLVAQWYADEYNKRNPPKFLQYLTPYVIEISTRTDPFRRLFYLEPFMDFGEYVKYSSNNRYQNLVPCHTTSAFSHFTYVLSKGKEMVVDIQGVGLTLTDPQVHSLNTGGQKFSDGDLGETGFQMFFEGHKCNPLCEWMKIQEDRVCDFMFGPEHGLAKPSITQPNQSVPQKLIAHCGHPIQLEIRNRAEWAEHRGKINCPKCK